MEELASRCAITYSSIGLAHVIRPFATRLWYRIGHFIDSFGGLTNCSVELDAPIHLLQTILPKWFAAKPSVYRKTALGKIRGLAFNRRYLVHK